MPEIYKTGMKKWPSILVLKCIEKFCITTERSDTEHRLYLFPPGFNNGSENCISHMEITFRNVFSWHYQSQPRGNNLLR